MMLMTTVNEITQATASNTLILRSQFVYNLVRKGVFFL